MAKLPAKDGMLPYSDVDEMIAEYNKNNGIFFGEEANIVAATTVAVSSIKLIESAGLEENVVGSNKIMSSTKNTDQLKAWYLKASKAERKEFRRWMIDQE